MENGVQGTLTAVVVDGKKRLMVPGHEVPGYVVRIWGQAKAGDVLYWLCDGVEIEIGEIDRVDLRRSNQFRIERRKRGA